MPLPNEANIDVVYTHVERERRKAEKEREREREREMMVGKGEHVNNIIILFLHRIASDQYSLLLHDSII